MSTKYSRRSNYIGNDSIFKQQPSVDNTDPTFMTFINHSSNRPTISVNGSCRMPHSSENSRSIRHIHKESVFDELNQTLVQANAPSVRSSRASLLRNEEHFIFIVEGGSVLSEKAKCFKFDLYKAMAKYYIYGKSHQVEVSSSEDAKTQAKLYRHGLEEVLE